MEGNETLYVQNLNEKIKPDDVRIVLYQLFAQYGSVLDVVTRHTYRMRGQAFIVYESKDEASTAMRLLQGSFFYGKPLRLSYAKFKSHAIAVREGSVIERDPELSARKRQEFFSKLALKLSAKQEQPQSNGWQLPNHILFLEGLSTEVSEALLESLFGLYPGLQSVRCIPNKRVAFVEYENQQQSSLALAGLAGYYISPRVVLNVAYAKR
jgi:RNA recognition motif-containing protein